MEESKKPNENDNGQPETKLDVEVKPEGEQKKRKRTSRMLKMNEYQITKLMIKCLPVKLCFVKVTKKYVLVLLNQAEDQYEKASKLLTNQEESGTLALDLAEFKEITDFALVSKFYNNNRNVIIRYLSLCIYPFIFQFSQNIIYLFIPI